MALTKDTSNESVVRCRRLRITVLAEEELEAVLGNLEGGQQAEDGVADAVGREVDLRVEVVRDLGGVAEVVAVVGEGMVAAVADEIGIPGRARKRSGSRRCSCWQSSSYTRRQVVMPVVAWPLRMKPWGRL